MTLVVRIIFVAFFAPFLMTTLITSETIITTDDDVTIRNNINVTDKSDNSEYNNVTSLADLLDFYNPQLLARQWGEVSQSISTKCKNDMEQFIEAFRKKKKWALKMEDATGRYSTGWFWGNYFWTGSKALCDSITHSSENANHHQVKISRKLKRSTISSTEMSPSQAAGYSAGRLENDPAPFPVLFFSLRINLKSNFTEQEDRILQLGMCLPYACSKNDAKNILEGTSKASNRIFIKVRSVRPQSQEFILWHDPTFIVLCVVTALVILLMISGTMYDLKFQKEKKLKNLPLATCISFNNNNNKRNIQEEKLGRKYSSGDNENDNFTQVEGHSKKDNKPTVQSFNQKLFAVWLAKKILLSFSLRTNFKSIFDQKVGSDTIAVIHGLKSISMAWVILGHACIIAFKYSDNMEYRKIVNKEFIFQTISNGTFSVDTFFFTSGLLVSFLYFRGNASGKLESPYLKQTGISRGIIRFVGLVVYRFARLSAPYLFVLGVIEVIMKYFYYNSIFEPAALDHINCPKYWWRNVLYINTWFPVDQMCMLWSWYISDDTQFYIVGAVVLLLASSYFKSSLALLIALLISSWTTTGYIAYSNNHTPGSDDPLAHFDKIYDKPWTRLGPYLVGMCVGWILFKTDCKIKMSKLVVVVGWLVSTGCLVSLVYGLYEIDLSPLAAAAYSSLSHTAWALGLAWIVIACTTGYGGYVNSILSASVLYPFSRVTYCTYLIHPIVIRTMTMTLDHPIHLGKMLVAATYIGQMVVSFAVAFVISIAFEAPVVSMLRILPKFSSHYQRNSR